MQNRLAFAQHQTLAPSRPAMIRPSYQVFEIQARSFAQRADEGWYFVMTLGKKDVIEPEGPYHSKEAAEHAAVFRFGLLAI